MHDDDDFDPFAPGGGAASGGDGEHADVRVISIGALDAHPLRNERSGVRTGHATTSLVRAGELTILVDPSLPAQVLAARLDERVGLDVSDITHVFLTSFRPDVRRGLAALSGATWWVSADEREAVGVPLAHQARHAEETGDAEARELLLREVALLHKCEPAPDELAPGVSLFPLAGVTPGLTGLLVEQDRHTLLIAGDAVPTPEHLEQGEAPRWAADLDQAKASFNEALEIADVLVLGRDNLVVNPRKGLF